jgi:hypothetical protein
VRWSFLAGRDFQDKAECKLCAPIHCQIKQAIIACAGSAILRVVEHGYRDIRQRIACSRDELAAHHSSARGIKGGRRDALLSSVGPMIEKCGCSSKRRGRTWHNTCDCAICCICRYHWHTTSRREQWQKDLLSGDPLAAACRRKRIKGGWDSLARRQHTQSAIARGSRGGCGSGKRCDEEHHDKHKTPGGYIPGSERIHNTHTYFLINTGNKQGLLV